MRYLASQTGLLDSDIYKKKLEERGRKFIEIDRTVVFRSLRGEEL